MFVIRWIIAWAIFRSLTATKLADIPADVFGSAPLHLRRMSQKGSNHNARG